MWARSPHRAVRRSQARSPRRGARGFGGIPRSTSSRLLGDLSQDDVDRVADGEDVLEVVLLDVYPVDVLDTDRQLDDVERIEPQRVEARFLGDLLGLRLEAAELVAARLEHLIPRDSGFCGHASSSLMQSSLH